MFSEEGSSTRPCQTLCKRSGSGNARGVKSVAFTTLNIVVLAPMPSVSVSKAVPAKPGCRIHNRTAYRTSAHTLFISIPPASLERLALYTRLVACTLFRAQRDRGVHAAGTPCRAQHGDEPECRQAGAHAHEHGGLEWRDLEQKVSD